PAGLRPIEGRIPSEVAGIEQRRKGEQSFSVLHHNGLDLGRKRYTAAGLPRQAIHQSDRILERKRRRMAPDYKATDRPAARFSCTGILALQEPAGQINPRPRRSAPPRPAKSPRHSTTVPASRALPVSCHATTR